MTRTLLFCFFSLFLCVSGFAQEEQNEDYNDTWRTPLVTDEMTVDSDQNKQWRMGESKFSAKPKNAWELGIALGHFHINGDVVSDLPSGYGIGLHIRKAINYMFSWRLEGQYHSTKGLDARLQSSRVLDLDNRGIGVSNVYPGGGMYRNFKTTNIHGNLSILWNLGNMLFHKERNKWNIYVGLGLGVVGTDVKMDYFNGENGAYDGIAQIEADFAGEGNTRAKRNAVADMLDGDYESTFENDRNVPGFLHDSGELFPVFVGSLGVSRKFSKRFNLTLEHQLMAGDYDQWDGHEYRTVFDQTNDSDIGHFTNLRLGINLGNFDNVTEPLYWLNPLDGTFNDIANLKNRPVLDIADDDGDGVLNLMDQEPGTANDCPVDTRGVTLDSDGDGLADCKDAEIYSPPGCPVDGKGVAQCPKPDMLEEADVQRMIDARPVAAPQVVTRTGCGEWYLPMIHFDNDKSAIKAEYYGHLHHVAEVMKKCPEICVTAHGHTDARNTNNYNTVLSYNRANSAVEYLATTYGIDRSRFKVMYGGEDAPLIKTSASNYMNRRVEFRVCGSGDYSMGAPSGASSTNSTINSGSYYNGNKSSGY